MFCHGELAARKPDPRDLTSFYLMISLGGAAGDVFVALIAPSLFNSTYEFPIGLGLCAVLWAILLPVPKTIVGLGIPLVVVAVYTGLLATGARLFTHPLAVRNFYGQLRITDYMPWDESGYRRLTNGTVRHGEQWLKPALHRYPRAYYCKESGVGRVLLTRRPNVPQRVGVVGLGCGTLATYGRAGDTCRFYEINPLVVQVANSQFTYLQDSPAKVEVALGDARLSLEREQSQQFDVLMIDAFSGDAIPVHLLTREAFEIYWRHLKPGGMVVVNVSNAHLNLDPVIQRAAASFGKIALRYANKPAAATGCLPSDWALIADPSIRTTAPELVRAELQPWPGFRMWTDDFSNVWSILLW